MKNKMKTPACIIAVLLMCAAVFAKGQADGKADAFPAKQVTIIMPWSLGGGPDTIARQVASYGEKYLGVPVIVENKTGGAGTIAMTAAMMAKDDGYTIDRKSVV